MQKHKNLLFFIIALILLAAALFYYRSDDMAVNGTDGAFALSADDKVSRIIVSDNQSNELQIEKQSTGVWLVNDSLAADEQTIREALFVLRRLEVKSPVAFEDRESAIQFLHKEGIRLEIYRESHLVTFPGDMKLFRRHKKIRTMLIAGGYPKENDHLVMHRAGHVPYLIDLPSGMRNLYETFPVHAYNWHSRKLMHYEPYEIRFVEIEHVEFPGESFSLHLDHESVMIFDHHGSPIDNSLINKQRLGRFVNGFRNLFYERAVQALNNTAPGDLFSDAPFMKIVIEDVYGEKRGFYFYRRRIPDDGTLISQKKPYDPNRFYLHEKEHLYLLSLYHIFQPVMRPLSNLMIMPEKE